MKAIKARISLQWSNPVIYRDVLLPEDMVLPAFHELIQIVMDWDESHMHVFYDKNRQPFDPAETDDYYDITVGEWLPAKGSKFVYLYDFGDSWHHEIVSLGKVVVADDQQLPTLLGGENAAPPEDSGGIPGFQFKLEVLDDPEHPEYAAYREWMGLEKGEVYDPTHFDAAEVNEMITSALEGGFFDGDYEEGEEAPSPEHLEAIIRQLMPQMELIDIDEGNPPARNFEWLEREHGIRLKDGDVRGTPQEALDFVALSLETDDPTPLIPEAERLHRLYPDAVPLTANLAAMYQFTGKTLKAMRLMQQVQENIMSYPLLLFDMFHEQEDEDRMRALTGIAQPLSITNFPPGEDNRYSAEEFLSFEHLAIYYYLEKGDLATGIRRLDRLSLAGFSHEELRPAANGVTQAFEDSEVEDILDIVPEVSERTDRLIAAAIREFLQMSELLNKARGLQ